MMGIGMGLGMGIRRKRKRKKKPIGLLASAARADARARKREKAAQDKLLRDREAWNDFGKQKPDLRKKLDKRRELARQFQAPRDYNVCDWSYEMYEDVLGWEKQRCLEAELKKLSKATCTERGVNKFLGLVKASSIPEYDRKKISLTASILRDALKNDIPLKKFESYRLNYGKSRSLAATRSIRSLAKSNGRGQE